MAKQASGVGQDFRGCHGQRDAHFLDRFLDQRGRGHLAQPAFRPQDQPMAQDRQSRITLAVAVGAAVVGSAILFLSVGTWLRRLAVSYVLLPDDPLDPPAEAEAAIVRSGRGLRLVARLGGWSVYRLPHPTPIATPARGIRVVANRLGSNRSARRGRPVLR